MISRTLRARIAILLAAIFLGNALAASAPVHALIEWLTHAKAECVTCDAPDTAAHSDSAPDTIPASHDHACHISHCFSALMAPDVTAVAAIAASAEPDFLSRPYSSRLPETPFKPPRQA